jgi:Family of unknown function (DUF6352)
MRHFWGSSGHLLLEPTDGGGLAITDEYLKAFLARPELLPPDDACATERALHASLLKEPRRAVSASDVAAIADADARENWSFMIGFRDRLIAAPTLEATYLGIVESGAKGVPPLFMNQMVHAILRNALDATGDAFVVRAAEAFFRPQRATIHEGTVLLADAEMIEGHEEDRHNSPLLAMLGGEAVTELEVITPEKADGYWARSDAFDMVLDLNGQPSGREALAEVIRLWIGHMLALPVSVTPLTSIKDADWRWFIGLDQEGTRIGNALWRGETLSLDDTIRVLALFRLDLPKDGRLRADLSGKAAYLILAMDGDRMVRLKPQNLLAGLPLQRRQAA